MEPDFSGYASRAGVKCTDGLTIMPNAFEHQDKATVPLMWQHGHDDPENILGHAVLENREDGVYAYAYFNNTSKAQAAKEQVKHKDITRMSIWANQLVKKGNDVLHGAIREVSLVISGANSGAVIEHVNIAHADGSTSLSDDELVIHSGLEFDVVEHADSKEETVADTKEKTVQDVVDSMSEEQKNVMYFLVAQAAGEDDDLKQSDQDDNSLTHNHEGDSVAHTNVFERNSSGTQEPKHLSHAQIKAIVNDAEKMGSFKEAFLAHAGTYGIDNIEVLFPDFKALQNKPEFLARRTEWVAGVLNAVGKSPFARIKTMYADITMDEARAKGYIKGNEKKEEVFPLFKRTTGPTTVYKKQKLDRDDIIDITDLDVVAWLKAEMRLMLDEELARAILVGDGRDIADPDKIRDPQGAPEGTGIRSIANDHELYAHKISMALSDANSSAEEIIEGVLRAKRFYKGSGSPSFYTTAAITTEMLLVKDGMDRRKYNSLDDVARAMGVKEIVEVEAMEAHGDIIGIVVNLSDYNLGADNGGRLAMFDDFDIDFNQYKYLLESRVSGALKKLKSALVIKREAIDLVTPAAPTFDTATDTITIPTTTGVRYLIDGQVVTGTVVITEITEVVAEATEGYAIAPGATDSWVFDPAA